MSSRGSALLDRPSSNPTLRDDIFKAPPGGPVMPAGPGLPPDPFAASTGMTVAGVINKTALLLALVVAAAAVAWTMVPATLVPVFLIAGIVVGLVLALVASFKPRTAPVIAPIYALVEGVVLGLISELYESSSSGITIMAVTITFATMGVMLLAYATKLIRVTQKFRAIVVTATLGILAAYLISFALGLFGVSTPLINDASPLGILISLFIVGVAALNLVLDFDFVARGAASNAPKYLEWYGAFGLTVTLIWLYLELLRLLSKLRR